MALGEERGKAEEGSDKQGMKDEKEMSEEDAIRLLDALKDDEKDLQRELRVQPEVHRYNVQKDW